jgi:hypothetical protein
LGGEERLRTRSFSELQSYYLFADKFGRPAKGNDKGIEARDEKKLLRFQKQIASYELLIVDELGFVPLSKTGAELLFEMLSQRYERGSTLITSNLPFQEWTEGPWLRTANRRSARPAHPDGREHMSCRKLPTLSFTRIGYAIATMTKIPHSSRKSQKKL